MHNPRRAGKYCRQSRFEIPVQDESEEEMNFERWKAEFDVRYQRMKDDVRDLVDRAKEQPERAKAALAPHREKLEAKQEQFAKALEDAKDRGVAGYDSLKDGVEKAWGDLKNAFEKFHQEMGGKPKED
jgi:hypothetical protein